MKKYIGIAVLLVIFLAVIAAAPNLQGALAGRNAFSEGDLHGAFAFSADGFLYPSFPALDPALPTVAVGIFSFDGAGGCSVMDQLNLASLGLVPPTGFRSSTTCQYSVNPDGTGTLVTSFGGSPGEIDGPGTLTFAIVDKGSVTEIRFIRVDPGAVASGVAREQ